MDPTEDDRADNDDVPAWYPELCTRAHAAIAKHGHNAWLELNVACEERGGNPKRIDLFVPATWPGHRLRGRFVHRVDVHRVVASFHAASLLRLRSYVLSSHDDSHEDLNACEHDGSLAYENVHPGMQLRCGECGEEIPFTAVEEELLRLYSWLGRRARLQPGARGAAKTSTMTAICDLLHRRWSQGHRFDDF